MVTFCVSFTSVHSSRSFKVLLLQNLFNLLFDGDKKSKWSKLNCDLLEVQHFVKLTRHLIFNNDKEVRIWEKVLDAQQTWSVEEIAKTNPCVDQHLLIQYIEKVKNLGEVIFSHHGSRDLHKSDWYCSP